MEGAPTAAAPTTLTVGAIASSGAAIMHATAAGMHADHAALSRVFLVLAVAQAAVAVVAFLRRDRVACVSLFVVNAGAAAGWLITRFVGIDQIDGLQVAESPTPADTIAAALAMVAVATAVTCALGPVDDRSLHRHRDVGDHRRRRVGARPRRHHLTRSRRPHRHRACRRPRRW
ncbi:MAG: hypothetical protein R2697_06120 [Ilumatobacteraceae bacterium]